jgi:PAS domain S-box-containing protein
MPSKLSRTHRRLRRIFTTALVLVIGIAGGGTLLTLWRLHTGSIESGGYHAEIITRSVEDYLTRNLQTIDLMVGTSLPVDPVVNRRRTQEMFVDSLRQMPLLRSLSLLDEAGNVVVSSNPANLGARLPLDAFFPVTEPNAELLRLGQPLAGRDLAQVTSASGTALAPDAINFIPVLHAFRAGERHLLLVASLNPDYLLNHVEHLLPREQGSVAIVRYDGVTLASSDPQRQPGSPDTTLVRAMDGGRVEFGQLAPDATGDGRLSAFRASTLYPAVVVTRLDHDMALKRWRQESLSLLGMVLPMMGLLLLVATILYRRQLTALADREAAERVQKLQATVFEGSLDAILITDPAGDIIAVNPAFSEMSGYAPGEVIGRNPRLLSSGRHDVGFYRNLWQELGERGVWRGEILNRRKDGSVYTASYAIIAFHSSSGDLLHYIGIASDVTEQRLQEARIEDLNHDLARRVEDAESANRAKTAFLANMSHELRTPLNHIFGFTSLLQRNPASPKAAEWLGRVEQSSQHLLHLIETILDVSRIESGRFELEPTDFSLPSLLAEVEGTARRKAEAKGLALDVFYAADLPAQLHADRIQLAQVIAQLLDNAVKFSAKGSISLRALVDTDVAGGLRLRIEIEDQGIGINHDQMGKLYSLFDQGDNSPTRQYGGTGIGLALCKRLADRMGGELEIRCNEGQGCLARLTLPVTAAQTPIAGE